MREVSIVGIGQTDVAEHWEQSLRQLATEAIWAALQDAHLEKVDALYVGNMLSGELTGQQHLGALVADHAGLQGVEAVRVEAACASGASALRSGYAAVAGGLADVVVVVGVEKMSDQPGTVVTKGLVSAADADFEAEMGLSFVAINALLMRRYMHEYGIRHDEFAPFVVSAHANAQGNPHAMLRFPVTMEDFARAKMIADPVNLLDSSPICDGAAALVLCSTEHARSLRRPSTRIRACSVGTDRLALHDRRNPLAFGAVELSARRAFAQAGLQPVDIDLFEAHDAFSIVTVLSLEACGFAAVGRGVDLGANGDIALDGRLPLSTLGGLKARGHPVGATGTYQVAELVLQLRGEAGKNQVKKANLGMAQNIGGSGATVVTTILEADSKV
ncbi:thiolase domain-containing protein [Myxococcota bacterium]